METVHVSSTAAHHARRAPAPLLPSFSPDTSQPGGTQAAQVRLLHRVEGETEAGG